jgi:Ca2+-binding RTX toxin-like protein
MVMKPSASTVCACLLMLAPAAHASYSFTLAGTTLTVTGDAASDVLSVQASAPNFIFDVGADGSPESTVDASTFDTLIINAGAGDDVVTIFGNAAAEAISVNGEAGDDVINGGNGGDMITGGEGDDTIDGNQGVDQVSGGAGRDIFVWDPGDGSDTLDGGPGSDVLRFTGSAANEITSLNPMGGPGQALLFRDIGNIMIDMTAIETVDVRLLGGTDTFTGGAGLAAIFERVQVHGGAGADTLTGGDSADTLDGGADAGDTLNGGAGDDTLIAGGDGDTLSGGDGNDRFTVTLPNAGLDSSMDGGPGAGDVLVVTGSAADNRFGVAGGAGNWTVSEAGFITLVALNMEGLEVHALGGDDSLTVATSALDALALDLDGGPGRDTFAGTNGADVMRGGDGDDTLRGGNGNDRLFGDGGTDRLLGAAGADEFHCAVLGDELDATAEDTVDADCLPAPPPPGDTTPPAVNLEGFPAAMKRGALAKSGLNGSVGLDEPAELEVALLGRLRGARGASAGDESLAEQALPLAPDQCRLVQLSPGRKLLRRLAGQAAVTLQVTAIDAAGNRTTATRQIGIRR